MEVTSSNVQRFFGSAEALLSREKPMMLKSVISLCQNLSVRQCPDTPNHHSPLAALAFIEPFKHAQRTFTAFQFFAKVFSRRKKFAKLVSLRSEGEK